MGNKRKPTQGPAARSKQRKITKGPKGRSQPARQQNVPLPPPSDDEQENYEVEDEDVEFVQQHAARLGFLTDLDTVQLNRSVEDKQKAAAAAAAAAGSDHEIHSEEELNSDEDAEEYERKPRAAEQIQKASSRGLPVKTPTGEVVYQPSKKQQQQLQAAKFQVEGVSVQDSLQLEQQMQKAAAKEEAAAAEAERQAAAKQQQLLKQQQKALAAKSAAAGEDAGALPPALLSLMSIQDQQQRRDALKQQMALAAQHLLAEPDKHVKQGLRLLLGCAADRDGQVARLALLSMLAVFKDILPGYRIRSLTEDEQEMRVSKEVAALREFEQSLLKSYQAYLKTLLAAATAKPAAGGSSSSVLATARIAVRCLGQLLVTKPGFNYSSDLLQALVPLMVHSDVQIREEACSCMQQLLREDIQGKTSLEAVQLVADLVKKKKCNVPPLVVSSLLVLRFEQVTPISQGGEGAGGKGPKKGSKSRKKRKKSDVDRDFEEADAAPDAAELAILQSQMLEALFEIFFRVLKHCSAATANHTAAAATHADPASAGSPAAAAAANGIHSQSEASHSGSSSTAPLVQPWPAAHVHKKFPLLQPCLEGLGRYSHLISVEYFNDLMTVLQQLLSAGALPVRERLGLLLSALDILKGQGEALTIDRRAFYNHLYQMLLLVPLHVLFEAPESSSAAAAVHVGANGTGSTAAAAVDDPAAELDDVEDEQALQAVTVSLLGWEAAGAAGDGSSSNSSREVVPTSVLLLRCLEQQLLGVKQTDMGRLAAFTKRLAELMLSSSTAEAVGAACLMWRLIKRYNKLVCQFEWEGGAPVGGRQYDPDCFDPSEAGGMAAALWELTLLTHHYHPHVAAAAKALLALTPSSSKAAAAGGRDDGTGSSGGTSNSAITGAAGPYELAGEYEATKRGGFRPPPAAPAGFKAARGAAAGSSRASMSARQAAAAAAWCQDLQQAASALKAGHQIVADETRQQQQQQQQLGKNRKQRQQKQQQVHQQQCLSMQELAALADDVDWQEFESAVQQHYHLSKQYDQNQRLQRELALTARKVELFREHLIQKRQQQQQQQQQQRKGAKKGRQQ